MLECYYAGTRLEFSVVYKSRKTIKIQIEPNMKIIVTAPIGASENVIIDIVKDKACWILKKQYMLKQEGLNIIHEFVNDEKFLFLGEEVDLIVILDEKLKKATVELKDKKLTVVTAIEDKKAIRSALELWYRKRTMGKVLERIDFFQHFFLKEPNSVKVKEQKRRWASCTYKDDILFNWRCIMAKEEVLDYIVVHEMCHMKHKNHSKQFWNMVQSILPDYKTRENWLKEKGSKMNF